MLLSLYLPRHWRSLEGNFYSEFKPIFIGFEAVTWLNMNSISVANRSYRSAIFV